VNYIEENGKDTERIQIKFVKNTERLWKEYGNNAERQWNEFRKITERMRKECTDNYQENRLDAESLQKEYGKNA
jgi:hypothetical protein